MWNPVGFHEIQRISHEILGHSPHPAFIKLKSFCCYKVLGRFHMKSGWNPHGFHRWNPPDFKGEICQISWVKSARFQKANCQDSHEILGHSPHPAFIKLKSFCCYKVFLGRFHMKSGLKSAGFHGWNPPDFERPIARNGKPYVYSIVNYSLTYPINIRQPLFCINCPPFPFDSRVSIAG